MQNIRVTVVRKLLQGDLVSGSEQWLIKHAIYYNRHDLTQKNTLMFVNRSETINWEEIDKKGPSLVISDKPLEELKKHYRIQQLFA